MILIFSILVVFLHSETMHIYIYIYIYIYFFEHRSLETSSWLCNSSEKSLIQKSLKIAYLFWLFEIINIKLILLCFLYCSQLYDEIILMCLDLEELDAAIAIVADLETFGITVPDQTLDRKMIDIVVNDVTS